MADTIIAFTGIGICVAFVIGVYTMYVLDERRKGRR